MRDYRLVMTGLSGSIPQDFSAVQLAHSSGEVVFELPDERHFQSRSLLTVITVEEVSFGNSNANTYRVMFLIDGARILFDSVKFWLYALSGTVPAFLLVIYLINRRLQTQLAREREVAIAEIARRISHDIRSPLTALNLIVSRSEQMPPAFRKLLVGATERIQMLAEDLLQESREQVSETRTPKVFFLSELVHQVLSELKIRYPDVRFYEHIQDSANNLVVEVRLGSIVQRVISNLLDNGAQACADSSKKEVRLEVLSTAETLSVVVQDTGIGMDTETLLKVGKPGFTSRNGGNGIGVSSAKEWATQSGGTFEISSEVGSGTRVQFIVPLTKPG